LQIFFTISHSAPSLGMTAIEFWKSFTDPETRVFWV